MQNIDYDDYYQSVKSDIEGLKEEYPFTKVIIIPTVDPSPIELLIVVANKDLIMESLGSESDFTGEYSKKVKVKIPFDYKKNGCHIWGAEWLEHKRIPPKDRHFYEYTNDGYRFCLGVPQSFKRLNNVLLENVKTVESMLVAYENYLCGNTKYIELIAYSHGDTGGREYDRNRHRYESKK